MWGHVSGEDIMGPLWDGPVSQGRDMVALTGSALGKKSRVTHLKDLPPEAWRQVQTPSPGYNYRVSVAVLGVDYVSLLDTGASTNAVPEELVLNIINQAFEKGLTPEARIGQLPWSAGTAVTKSQESPKLEIIGAAVIPYHVHGS